MVIAACKRQKTMQQNRTPALLHCKQGRVGGNYSSEPKARMSKHVTRAHGWCAFVCRGSDRARRSYWPCQKGCPLMLSLTANGEVPVLWVDGATVADAMFTQHQIQSTGRRSTPRGPPDAAHSRLCMPPATEDACVCQTQTPRMPASATQDLPRQVVRLAQVDPGPEDQHHSNQHEVQLGYSRAAPHIAGSLNLFSERPRGSPLENFARLA